MCNIRKHPSWRTAQPTRPQHPSSQTRGLQASVQGQGLSDLSQRCHPTPEHTQHTPPWHPEQRRAQAPSPQLRAAWHHGLRSHLQPQELLGSSTLAAHAAGQHPTRTTGNCQHQPVRENHSHYPSRKVSKGHSFPAHLPACPSALLQLEPSSCIHGLGVTSSSPGCFNI